MVSLIRTSSCNSIALRSTVPSLNHPRRSECRRHYTCTCNFVSSSSHPLLSVLLHSVICAFEESSSSPASTTRAFPATLTPHHCYRSSTTGLTDEMLPDDSISYRGQWSFETDVVPGQSLSFHASSNAGDRASVQFNGELPVRLADVLPHAHCHHAF